MSAIVAAIVEVALLLAWMAGVVLAHGFWSTFFAVFMPPYAIYLVVERLMIALGWVT